MARQLTRICIVVVVLFVAAGPALANITIDFEDFPVGPFASYTKSGVTFTASGGGGSIFTVAAPPPNNTKSIGDFSSPQKELRADIASGATFVSVDLGDYGSDSELLFLEIFDVSDASLGFTDIVISDSFAGMKTLSLSASNIAYAVFGARDASSGGGSSVTADNFEFTPIPAPGAILLCSIGVGFVGWLRIHKGL
jgi:hypothetical protein